MCLIFDKVTHVGCLVASTQGEAFLQMTNSLTKWAVLGLEAPTSNKDSQNIWQHDKTNESQLNQGCLQMTDSLTKWAVLGLAQL